jgi:hypothetical protein
MSYPLRIVNAVAIVAISTSCANYYDGTVAELEHAAGLTVELATESYGDCFRRGDVPVVYKVVRPNYTVRIAHGMRYWPEFFLSAQDNHGNSLNITGPGISALTDQAQSGGDMRRLRESRGGIDLSNHTRLLDMLVYDGRTKEWVIVKAVRENKIGIRTLAFDVRNGSGVLGTEQLAYRVNIIRCRESVGP